MPSLLRVYLEIKKMTDADDLRQSILAQVADYYRLTHADKDFVTGESRVHYAGRVYDAEELQSLVGAALDFWLTAGPVADQFERQLGQILGVREIIPVNSGSSANLVAVTALCSKQLRNGLKPRPSQRATEIVGVALHARLPMVIIINCPITTSRNARRRRQKAHSIFGNFQRPIIV